MKKIVLNLIIMFGLLGCNSSYYNNDNEFTSYDNPENIGICDSCVLEDTYIEIDVTKGCNCFKTLRNNLTYYIPNVKVNKPVKFIKYVSNLDFYVVRTYNENKERKWKIEKLGKEFKYPKDKESAYLLLTKGLIKPTIVAHIHFKDGSIISKRVNLY